MTYCVRIDPSGVISRIFEIQTSQPGVRGLFLKPIWRNFALLTYETHCGRSKSILNPINWLYTLEYIPTESFNGFLKFNPPQGVIFEANLAKFCSFWYGTHCGLPKLMSKHYQMTLCIWIDPWRVIPSIFTLVRFWEFLTSRKSISPPLSIHKKTLSPPFIRQEEVHASLFYPMKNSSPPPFFISKKTPCLPFLIL